MRRLSKGSRKDVVHWGYSSCIQAGRRMSDRDGAEWKTRAAGRVMNGWMIRQGTRGNEQRQAKPSLTLPSLYPQLIHTQGYTHTCSLHWVYAPQSFNTTLALNSVYTHIYNSMFVNTILPPMLFMNATLLCRLLPSFLCGNSEGSILLLRLVTF